MRVLLDQQNISQELVIDSKIRKLGFFRWGYTIWISWEIGATRNWVLNHMELPYIYIYICTYIYIHNIYIYRAEAGGSPEGN